jgi:two-component system response regulator AtoC
MPFPKKGTIVIGEDEPEVRGHLETVVKCLGYSVELAQDGQQVINYLRKSLSGISAVLLDLMRPQLDAIETLQAIRCIAPDLLVIIVSGGVSTTNIVAALECGANSFLCKPVAHEDLEGVIREALASQAVAKVDPASRAAIAKSRMFIGNNPQMKQIYLQVRQIGWSEAPALIQGETGTGKEVLARDLHANSRRANKPFIKLNCATLPSELVESELFGHERGAFTGAFEKRPGMFEMADGGTLFLDEIGDMDVSLQAKLLHVIQDLEFRRIGGRDMINVDVRIMAATHRDLEQAIAEKEFREDLYYRLNVVNLHIPSLRERREDILPLAEYMLEKHAADNRRLVTVSAELKQALAEYDWPGNVRELENVIRRFLVLRDANVIVRDLYAKSRRRSIAPPVFRPSSIIIDSQHPTTAPSSDLPILQKVTQAKEQAETETILAALNSTRWNRKRAATLLTVDYKALLYKMKKLGIEEKAAAMTSTTPDELHIAAAAGGR